MGENMRLCECMCIISRLGLSPFSSFHLCCTEGMADGCVGSLDSSLRAFSMERVEPLCYDCSLDSAWREHWQNKIIFSTIYKIEGRIYRRFIALFLNCFSWATCPWGLILWCVEPQKILAAVVLHVAKNKQKTPKTIVLFWTKIKCVCLRTVGTIVCQYECTVCVCVQWNKLYAMPNVHVAVSLCCGLLL